MALYGSNKNRQKYITGAVQIFYVALVESSAQFKMNYML